MAIDPSLVLTGVTALGGLFGRKKKKDPMLEAAERQANISAQRSEALWRMAEEYDPSQETEAILGNVTDRIERSVGRQMRFMDADYRRRGGNPFGDTAYGASVQGLVNNALAEPLARITAESKAQEFQKKMQAYQAANASAPPGQVGAQYQALVGQQTPNMGPSQQVLAGVIDQVMATQGPAKKKKQMEPGEEPNMPNAMAQVAPGMSVPTEVFRRMAQTVVPNAPRGFYV